MALMHKLRIESESFIPSKIVCIGRNYLEHIRELGNETPDAMVIFNKPNSAISRLPQPIKILLALRIGTTSYSKSLMPMCS